MRYRLNELRNLISEAILNAYEILGVPRFTATDEEIRQAYRRKAIQMHPDRNRDRDTTSDMMQVNVARDILLDKTPARSGMTRRQELDRELRGTTASGPTTTGPESPADFWARREREAQAKKSTYSNWHSSWSATAKPKPKKTPAERAAKAKAHQDRADAEDREWAQQRAAKAPASNVERKFEYIGGKSSKFWNVKIDKEDVEDGWWYVTVTFGRIGTTGRIDRHNYLTYAGAKNYADSKIQEKLNKGYKEVTKRPSDTSQTKDGGQPKKPAQNPGTSTSGQSKGSDVGHDRKIYGRKGKFDVHTRVKGKVYGKAGSKFSSNDRASTYTTPDGKLHVSSADGSKSQIWEPEE